MKNLVLGKKANEAIMLTVIILWEEKGMFLGFVF